MARLEYPISHCRNDYSMNLRNFLTGAFLCVLAHSPLMAAPSQKSVKPQTIRPYGMFSNLEISRETGDVGGVELFFFHAGRDFVLIVRGEGELRQPILCEVVTKGNSILFQEPSESERKAFQGTFSATHLSGKFSDGSSLKVPRKQCRMMTSYSGISVSRETGDVMGMEIVLFLADQPYALILQAEGEFLPPQVVPVREDEKRVQFNFKRGGGEVASFNGAKSQTFLSGVLSTPGQPNENLKIPAKKSFWQ